LDFTREIYPAFSAGRFKVVWTGRKTGRVIKPGFETPPQNIGIGWKDVLSNFLEECRAMEEDAGKEPGRLY
jgi:hypothetical protein